MSGDQWFRLFFAALVVGIMALALVLVAKTVTGDAVLVGAYGTIITALGGIIAKVMSGGKE